MGDCLHSRARLRRLLGELGCREEKETFLFCILELILMVRYQRPMLLRSFQQCFLLWLLPLLLLLLLSHLLSLEKDARRVLLKCGSNGVSKEVYAPALGGIMLSIGIKLSIDDFALAFKRPLPLSVGFLAQYALKPALGVLIAKAFGMSRMFYAGFVLTSCVAGAQLSSYASFLSKGDVAVSILLTSSTTIASALVTPLLTGLLIGSVVPVDAIAMSKSILQVVLVPVTLGLVLNTYAKPVVNVIQPVMPFVAIICTSICIGSPLAINRSQILSSEGLRLVLPVLAFHTVAFTFGYWVSRIPALRLDEEVSRTISLCTGMQSSTMAGLLASQFLGTTHAVPPACSVVAMAIMGLSLASFWGNGSRIRDLPSRLFPRFGTTVKA
ncbi:probable sodium/metabolite cotransporter BASS3, chloroplastic isoform X2 [Manihot esculenta]|uniref:probable sodium/metabolite cotransporter BASS3, chloroplastic isoform X2 n=1 Tax=Manihot esculenta TaxID=3983 RepID=UPI000B5D3B75|nr:probable sodium/metabolite cotransporter BASS3, chloroplastic isoform X2 [Manihot esculenta]